jgi:hypothetical protein
MFSLYYLSHLEEAAAMAISVGGMLVSPSPRAWDYGDMSLLYCCQGWREDKDSQRGEVVGWTLFSFTGVIQILQSREGEDEEACSTRQGRHWGDPILGQCDDRLAL